jgi:hypothetical protein
MRNRIAVAGTVLGLLFAAGCSSLQSASLTPSNPGTARTTLDVIAVPLANPTADPTAAPVGASAIPVGASAFPIGASAFPIGLSAFPIGASAFPIDATTGCTVVTDSLGHRFRAARLGGGDNITIDRSKTRCDVGVYIDSRHGPAKLDHTTVTGAFLMGVYVDTVAKVEIDHLSICVDGVGKDATCKAGNSLANGVGLMTWSVDVLKIHQDHVDIDGYSTAQYDY